MNGRLPWYKHMFCDCGGIIRVKDLSTCICEKCGKESNLTSIDFKCILSNAKTGWMYPVVDREDN